MPVFKVRASAEAYGHSIGILLMDDTRPIVPGDIAHAASFNFPVLYKVVRDLTPQNCLNSKKKLTSAIIDAALRLEEQGVRAITSDCSLMLTQQEIVRSAVKVAVCLSPVMLLPLVSRSLDRSRAICLMGSRAKAFDADLLRKTHTHVPNKIIHADLTNAPEFIGAISGNNATINTEQASTEIVRAALDICKQVPTLGAFVFEDSALPPYADAVRRATGLPVYDAHSMINYLSSASDRKYYSGFY